MPLLFALGGLLLNIAGSLAGRVLIALSIGFVTYSGFNFLIDWLFLQIKSNIAAMPADIVSFLAWMWVDRAISLLFSAYAAAVLVKMAGGSTLTKMVTKK